MKYQPGLYDQWISPINGQLYDYTLLPDLIRYYVLLGNGGNRPVPSPIVKDMRLEFRQLKLNLADTKFIIQTPSAIVPEAQALDQLVNGMLKHLDGVVQIVTLTHNKLWMGDENNYPIEVDTINLSNMAALTHNLLWRGDVTNRPEEIQRIGLFNLPSFTTTDPTVNFGLYNLYTGTFNILNPLEGVVPSTTKTIHISNMSNLGVGKIWLGKSVPPIPPVTIDNIPPYVHGQLNWGSDRPVEVGLDPGTIFMGSYEDEGQIIAVGLPKGHIFMGNPSDQIAVQGLLADYLFVGEPENSGEIISKKILSLDNMANLTNARIFMGNADDRPVITGLGDGLIFKGNSSGDIIQVGLMTGQILIGDSSGKIVETGSDGNGLLYKELFTGNSDNSGALIAITVLHADNMANLTNGKLWLGNEDDRPVITQTIQRDNLPNLTFGKILMGDESDRPIEVDPTYGPDDATYVVRTANASLPNAQALDTLEDGIAVILNGLVSTFSIEAGTGITVINGNATLGDPTISISNTGVVPGSYPYANVTCNAQGQITTISSDLSTITTIQSDILTLQGRVTTVEGEITAIHGEIATIQGEIVTLQGEVLAIQGQVAAIEATLYTPVTGVVAVLAVTAATVALDTIKVAQHDLILTTPVVGLVARMNDLTQSLTAATLQGKVILQEPNVAFPNGQALNALGTGGILRCDDDGVISIDVNATGLADLSTSGLISRISSGNFVTRALAVSGDGISINDADGTLGNPTLTLDLDLQLFASTIFGSGSGFVARSQILLGAGVYTPLTFTGGTGISVASGDGSAGNPVISLSNTTVVAGSYTYPSSITVNAQGQLTAASSGTAPVTSVSGTTDQITVSGTTSVTVGIANNPVLPGTGAVTVPKGTTAQRPSSPVVGMIRFNTDLGRLEAYY